jgi:hypothetical protein
MKPLKPGTAPLLWIIWAGTDTPAFRDQEADPMMLEVRR